MYQHTQQGYIRRISDNAFIPMVEGNSDYDAYLIWVNAGNLTLPVELPNPNEAIDAQIEAIERETMVPRVLRELALVQMEDLATRKAAAWNEANPNSPPYTAATYLAVNSAYVKTKAVDDQIRALRAQRT